jgi:hypothetical protein
MLPRHASLPVSALSAVLVLAACTGDSEPAADPTPSPSPEAVDETPEAPEAEALEVDWSTDLPLFSGPRRAGDVVVAYVTDDDRLYLVGVEGSSGDELWRQEASPGEVVTGIGVTPRVIDGYPVYYRPSDVDNLFAQLVVADPNTGEDVVVTEPKLFQSVPAACTDDETAICVRVRDSYEGTGTAQRLEIDGDGSLVRDTALAAAPSGSRSIGSEGLLDVRSGDTEYLAAYDSDDGDEMWRLDISEIFGENYSTNFGWGWYYDRPTDRYVGYVDSGHDDVGETQVLDLSRNRLVAIERSTGDVEWTEDGVRHLCYSTLNVPTDEEQAARAAGEDSPGLAPLPVRCRTEGTVTFGGGDDGPELDDIDVTLEGFDPATGATTWDVPLGAALPLLGWLGSSATDEPVLRVDTTGAVLTVDGEPTVIDLATGETREFGDETLWCSTDTTEFEYREPYYFSGEPTHTRRGERLTTWCDASGEIVDDPDDAPAVVPNGIGTQIGDLRIVGTPDGLVAYR